MTGEITPVRVQVMTGEVIPFRSGGHDRGG